MQVWQSEGGKIPAITVMWALSSFVLIIWPIFSLGEQGSFSHGSVVDGRFEGFIQTHTGTFYIEPADRYIKDRTLPFHSVMYHEDDISKFSF